jgi:hypothetical protein
MAECACGAECDTAGSWCLVAPDASSHVAASSSRNAVSFSSDRTVKRRPSRVYASAVKITRPVKSISDEQPQLKPALLQSAESQFCSNAHRPLASLEKCAQPAQTAFIGAVYQSTTPFALPASLPILAGEGPVHAPASLLRAIREQQGSRQGQSSGKPARLSLLRGPCALRHCITISTAIFLIAATNGQVGGFLHTEILSESSISGTSIYRAVRSKRTRGAPS